MLNTINVRGKIFPGCQIAFVSQLWVAQAFQPVLAQAKACGYIFPFFSPAAHAKSLPDTTDKRYETAPPSRVCTPDRALVSWFRIILKIMLKPIFREIIRYYLRSFPLRDGKKLVYDLFNQSLAPSKGYVEVEMAAGFKLKLDLNEPAERMIYFFRQLR